MRKELAAVLAAHDSIRSDRKHFDNVIWMLYLGEIDFYCNKCMPCQRRVWLVVFW